MSPDLRILTQPASPVHEQHQDLPFKIGLLGGSFNPIHNGHLTIAHHVYERMQLSGVLFIPNGDPPHKRDGSLAPANVRLEMVQLAIADSPLFHISDIEMQRNGKSYSIDTVRALQITMAHPRSCSSLLDLTHFLTSRHGENQQELLKICHFVVVPRPGRSFRALAKMPLLPA